MNFQEVTAQSKLILPVVEARILFLNNQAHMPFVRSIISQPGISQDLF